MRKILVLLAAAAVVLAGGVVYAAAAADPDVAITRVNYNAVGADTTGNRWQEAIYLRARADLAEPLDVGGWTVHDSYTSASGEHTNAYTFPAGTVVKPNGLIVVSPAAGVNKTDPNATQLYYMDFKRGYRGHFINNGGDTLALDDEDGNQVARFSFDFDNGYYVR
ncbi:lamin tail domain-containing protein [Nonomuraea sp. NPDC023979]|uniref:lamin tail domain-containing protein n=1 Tax=Nonomuraea sp. NPDC023979 TaxID=3154796 RepID=UPI003409B5BF